MMSEEEMIEQPANNNPLPAENNDTVSGPSIINDQQSTENMEVHKHPHHVTHKKKWTEYLLEFFMLFFAVFLGFVAENVREHYAEKNKAKEFAKTLVNDLKKDTTEFSAAIVRKEVCVYGIDTLVRLLRREDYQSRLKEITKLFPYIRNNYYVTRHDATEQQMISSGSLRYFNNAELYNGITGYYADVKTYNENNNLYYLSVHIIDQLAEIFDFKNSADTTVHLHDVTDANKWLPNNFPALNRFIIYSSLVQTIYGGQVKTLSGMKQHSIALIDLINKEYHLQNE
jgi:hypothetical protein